ncbi:MAG: cytoplasmic protein [Colwellia sp.]|nr:cytoplasmic protein [Colwellia sp.]
MSLNINQISNFAPTNNGNGTILEVAVKAKSLAEEEGKMVLKLIESAGTSNSKPVSNIGHNVNISA